jgi:uncharacterized protein
MKFLPQMLPITSFGNGGFRFGSHSHLGSLLVLPSGMRAWSVGEIIETSDFSELLLEHQNFDLVVFGTGREMIRPRRELRDFFSAQNLNMEYMSTSSAVHNYNVLLAEGRRVSTCLVAVS